MARPPLVDGRREGATGGVPPAPSATNEIDRRTHTASEAAANDQLPPDASVAHDTHAPHSYLFAMSTQETIDIIGGVAHTLVGLVLTLWALAGIVMARKPYCQKPSPRLMIASTAGMANLIIAAMYWISYFQVFIFLRAADNVLINVAYLVGWIPALYLLGKAWGYYLLLQDYWVENGAWALLLAFTGFFLQGYYVGDNQSDLQLTFFVFSLAFVLGAIILAFFLRAYRTGLAPLIVLVVSALGLLFGHVLAYVLSPYYTGIISSVTAAWWFLAANVIVIGILPIVAAFTAAKIGNKAVAKSH